MGSADRHPPTTPSSSHGSQKDLQMYRAGDFQSTFRKLFRKLISKRKISALKDWILVCLKELFEKLSEAGSDVSMYSNDPVYCLRCAETMFLPYYDGEIGIVMESKQEYNLLLALEMLGNTYNDECMYLDAYSLYSMAYSFYENRFDRVFLKSRELKMKIAKTLVEWGNLEKVFDELRVDAEIEKFGTALEAEITLYLKHAYGRALLSKNLTMEAVPYLCIQHLGKMDFNVKDTLEVLQSVIRCVMEQLSEQNVEFAMCMALNLFDVFAPRLQRGDCPVDIFEFSISFCDGLISLQFDKHFVALHNKAAELNLNIDSFDTNLLASILGIFFHENHANYDDSLKGVLRIHNELLSSVEGEDDILLARLAVTTKLIYFWIPCEKGLKFISDVSKKVLGFIQPGHRYYNFFLECGNGVVSS